MIRKSAMVKSVLFVDGGYLEGRVERTVFGTYIMIETKDGKCMLSHEGWSEFVKDMEEVWDGRFDK